MSFVLMSCTFQCDECGAVETISYRTWPNAGWFRATLRELGWRRKRNAEGKMMDLCPAHGQRRVTPQAKGKA